MNDKLTFELFTMFPDQESARIYLESRLWSNGCQCPVCGIGNRVTARKNGFYRCNRCSEDFTVRTGTIFERSHIPLHKWLYATSLLVTARKGISSLQLSKEIDVTQKSAWFMLLRLREACGVVEVDKTYIGGKDSTKLESKNLNVGRGAVGKTAVIGMRQRGGSVKELTIPTELNLVVDSILVFRPKPKSEPAKKRAKARKKLVREPKI